MMSDVSSRCCRAMRAAACAVLAAAVVVVVPSTASAQAPQLPEAPAAPTLTAGHKSIGVTWVVPQERPLSPINDFDVAYCEGSSAECPANDASKWTEWDASTTSLATSATITGLKSDGTAYQVRVRAGNANGDSAWSTAAGATPDLPAAPAAPTLSDSSGTLTINWSAPSDTGSASLTDYRLRFKKDNATEWSSYYDASLDHRGPSARSTGDGKPLYLKGTTTFSGVTLTAEPYNNNNYRVYKVGSAASDMRLRVSGATGGSHRNIHARHHSAFPTAMSQGTSLWTEYANPSFSGDGTTGPLAANSYFWVYGDGAEKGITSIRFQLDVELLSTATSTTISSVPNGTTYEMQVQAVTSRGASAWSASATHLVGTAPVAPAAPTLLSGGSQLEVSWTAPSGDGGFAVSDYDVRHCAGTASYCDVTDASKWTQWQPSTTSTELSTTVTGLTNGSLYQVQVRAQNAKGDGAWSARSAATVGAPDAPSAPTLTAGDGQLTAAWTAPASNGSSITDYDVRYRISDTNSGQSGNQPGPWLAMPDTTDSAATTLTVSDATNGTLAALVNNTSYDVQVRAQNTRGAGAWSPSASVTPTELPAAPAAPTLTAGNAQLAVSWAAPSGSAIVDDYDVRYRACTAADTSCATSPAWASNWTETPDSSKSTTLSATLSNLANGTAYQVQVRAGSLSGDGPWSPSTQEIAGRPATPAAPALNTGSTQLVATWTAPANHGSAITSYRVRHRETGTTEWTTASFPSAFLSATISGLTNATTYEVQVRATSAAGHSDWSASAEGTAGAPVRPAAPTLAAGNARLAASWTAPAANGASIHRYDVQYRLASAGQWTAHYPTSHDTGPGSNWSTGPQSPLNLGQVQNFPVTITWEVLQGNGRIYKVGSAVAGLRLRVAGNTGVARSIKLRYAATRPSTSNVATHGTELWSVQRSSAGPFTGDGVTPPLAAGSYFWVYGTGSLAAVTGISFRISEVVATTSTSISGLTNDVAYDVRVRAVNARGAGPWSPAATATPTSQPPSAPAAPAATAGNGSLAVSWTAPADNGSPITDYDIRYCAGTATHCDTSNASRWTQWQASTLSTSTSTTITPLTNGTAYHLQVRATNAKGDSAWSPAAKQTPGTPATPAAPTVAASGTTLTVTWTAATTNGLAVTDYDVRYSSDSGATWTEWNASQTSTATSASLTELAPNTAYQVQVRAASSAGDSPWSPSSSGTTATGPPNTPAAPALASGDRQFTAAWTAPPTGGSAILDYDVRWRESGTSTWTENTTVETWGPTRRNNENSEANGKPLNLGNIDFTSVSVAEENTSQGHPGLYKLGADVMRLYLRTNGRTGALARPTIYARYSSSKPTGSLATAGSHLYNDPNDGNDRYYDGSAWSGYLAKDTYFWAAFEWNTTATESNATVKVEPRWKTTTRTVTGLTNGTAYEVQVRAENLNGIGGWSPAGTVTAGLPDAPDAPALASGDRRISATWSAPASHGAAITDYDVQISADGGSTWAEWNAGTSTATSTVITSLVNGTAYRVRVRAESSRGAGPWSAASSITAGVPAAPAAPYFGAGLGSRNGSLTPSWRAPAGHGSSITDYDVRYCAGTASQCPSDDASVWTSHPHSGTTRWSTIQNLTNGTLYQIQVRATNARGAGAWSPSGANRPGRPAQANAPAVNGGDRQVSVSWSAGVANGLSITDYDVVYRASGESAWTAKAHTGTGLSTTITGLKVGTTYQVRIRASSSAGPGPWSTAGSAKTTTGVPDAPTPPVLSADGATILRVTWAAPTNNGAAISSYTLRYREAGTSSWTEQTSAGTGTTATISSLINLKTYEVQVRAVNSVGNGGWSDSSSTTLGAPSAPAAPTLTAPASGQLGVSWTAPANNGAVVDRYSVRFRAQGTSAWRHIYSASQSRSIGTRGTSSSEPAHLGSFSVTGVTITTEAFALNSAVYKVGSAVDGLRLRISGSMGNHPTVSVRYAATKPTSSTVATHGSELWTVAGGGSFTGDGTTPPLPANAYFWFYGSNSSSQPVASLSALAALDSGTTATSATLTGLTNGTTYEVAVRAHNARGFSGWGTAATATPTTVPSAPSAPSLTTGDRQLEVSWTAPSNGGAAISDYDVRYSSDGGTSWTETDDTTPSTSRSVTIIGLANGTTYQVQVRAENVQGVSLWSASASASPAVPVGVPDAPAAPHWIPKSTQGALSIDVSWTAPADNGSSIADYDLRYSSDGGSSWTEWMPTQTSTATSATLTGVTSGTTYQVQVRAANLQGDGAWSASASASFVKPGTSGAVSVTRPDGALSVSWPAVPGAGWYHVVYSSDGRQSWTAAASQHTTPSITITGANNASAYVVGVRAGNDFGWGGWQHSATAAPTLVPPGTVSSVSVSRSEGVLSVSWPAVATATKYHVTYSSDGGGSWTLAAAEHATASIEITGADSTLAYVVAVRAGNAAGWGGWRNSPSAAATLVPPGQVSSVSVSRSDGVLSVSWPAPATATKYHVTYSSDGGSNWALAAFEHASASIEITGADNNLSYVVAVRAGNAAGWGGWRNSAAAGPWWPANTPPNAPASVTLSRQCGKPFTVSWDPVPGATGYDMVTSSTNRKSWQRVKTNTPHTFWVFGQWSKNKPYTVGVRSVNAAGHSTWTNSPTVPPPSCG